MKKAINSVCMVIFEVTLPLFLIMGAVLVFTQLFGALMGNGALVKGVNTALKTYSVWVASICAFSGFIMGYTREKNPAKSE